jgi:ribosome-associated toxin RatA of RatAB toxin-antitoxin module
MSWGRWLRSGILVAALAAPCLASAQIEVRIERKHGVFQVHAESAVAVDAATAWQVLTDYNELARFVPDMRSSRIVSAPGRPLLLEQHGEAGFLIFNLDIQVVLQIDETPPDRLAFRAVSGNMKRMQGEWRIQRDARTIRLAYQAEIEPDFWVPPLIGSGVLKRNVERQVSGVVQEMLKRYGAGATTAAPPARTAP